jgi:hypothetical protein
MGYTLFFGFCSMFIDFQVVDVVQETALGAMPTLVVGMWEMPQHMPTTSVGMAPTTFRI